MKQHFLRWGLALFNRSASLLQEGIRKNYEEAMQFRLVKTGKRYSRSPEDHPTTMRGDVADDRRRTSATSTPIDDVTLVDKVPVGTPVIWRGTVDEYFSLLVLREAELIAAKAQLTGNDSIDWYAKNRILDLEIKVADLKKWLAEAMTKEESLDSNSKCRGDS